MNEKMDKNQNITEENYRILTQKQETTNELLQQLIIKTKEKERSLEKNFNPEEGDYCGCGRCGMKFFIIEEFTDHKETCNRKSESQKIKATVLNMGNQWESDAQEFINHNRIDTEDAMIEKAESGSLVIFGKVSLSVFSSKESFSDSIVSLLSKLFRYCPPPVEEGSSVVVDIDILENDDDEDQKMDIYHCGLCDKDCYGVLSFVMHKESIDHYQNREFLNWEKTVRSRQRKSIALSDPRVSEQAERLAGLTSSEFDQDKSMCLNVFEDGEALNRVSDRHHIIDGAKVQVNNHEAQMTYADKVLVNGLNDKISNDDLIYYLEARTKTDVGNVEFSNEDTGKAIVTFEESIDIKHLQELCQRRSVNGNHLSVQPVAVSNCIIVRDIVEEITENKLKCYFDNKEMSGVDGVLDVKMVKNEEYCLVYFDKYEDALEVCRSSHTIDNCRVQVHTFYECLGIPFCENLFRLRLLAPVTFENIDQEKINFVQNNAIRKSDFEKCLHSLHAIVLWPTIAQRNLTIFCTMTRDNYRQLGKTWTNNIRKAVKTRIESLVVESFTVPEETSTSIFKQVKHISISYPESVSIKIETEPFCKVILVGKTTNVLQISAKVKQTIESIKQEFVREKQHVQEKVQINPYQLKILDIIEFNDQVTKTLLSIDISTNRENNTIIFTGITKDVNAAKMMMYETFTKITSVSVGQKSKTFIQFFEKPEVKLLIRRNIKSKGILGVWEIQNNDIIIYSLSNEDAVAVADIVNDSITESKVHIDIASISLLMSYKWSNLIKLMEKEYTQKNVSFHICVDKQNEITLLCTDKGEIGDLERTISEFVIQSNVYEINIEIQCTKLKFLQEYMLDCLHDLEKRLKRKNIAINVKTDSIRVRGNHQGIEEAKRQINLLVESIYKKQIIFRKLGLDDFLSTFQGEKKLKQIGKRANVLIISESGLDHQSHKDSGCQDLNIHATAVYSTKWGQEVIVTTDDFMSLTADVFVIAANNNLEHTGGLARDLMNKGGQSIQDECEEHIFKHGRLSDGEVFYSGSGHLKCKTIAHAVIPTWKGGMQQEIDHVSTCVIYALKETARRQLSSIAFPLLCAGSYCHPSEEATKIIVQAVNDYFQDSSVGTSILKVYLCNNGDQNENGFEKQGYEIFGKAIGGSAYDVGLHGRSSGQQSKDEATTGTSSNDFNLNAAQVPVVRDDVPNKVTLAMYARDWMSADNATRILEQSIDQEYTERVIRSPLLFNSKYLQIKEEIKKMSKCGKLKIDLDEKKNEIKIRGLILSQISNAVDVAYELIRSAEEHKLTKRTAVLAANTVQWFYMEEDDGKYKLVAYSAEKNLLLETAIKEQKKNITLHDKRGTECVVDLENCVQYPADDPTCSSQVIRKVKQKTTVALDLPLVWNKMEEEENFKLVTLNPTDIEYINVIAKFQQTGDRFELVKVERVQNKILYQQYKAKQLDLEAANPKGHQNERELWHGSTDDCMDIICRNGLNRRYCGKNATMLGTGVYFAVDANYSLMDKYALPDKNGHKRVLLCKVLVGEYCRGRTATSGPRVKRRGNHIVYDSVVDDVNNPKIFVIFYDSQTLPVYLFTVKKK